MLRAELRILPFIDLHLLHLNNLYGYSSDYSDSGQLD